MAFQDARMRALQSGGPRAGVLTHLTPVKRLKNSKGEKNRIKVSREVQGVSEEDNMGVFRMRQ